jgi:hypothetical protein
MSIFGLKEIKLKREEEKQDVRRVYVFTEISVSLLNANPIRRSIRGSRGISVTHSMVILEDTRNRVAIIGHYKDTCSP